MAKLCGSPASGGHDPLQTGAILVQHPGTFHHLRELAGNYAPGYAMTMKHSFSA